MGVHEAVEVIGEITRKSEKRFGRWRLMMSEADKADERRYKEALSAVIGVAQQVVGGR